MGGLVKKFALFLIVLSLSVIVIGLLFAADEVGLDTIVVTAHRYEEAALNAPAALTVISQRRLRESNALTCLDALRSVPGLVVKDWFGSGTKASADIRGFGEQSGMNVLVLVDGRRVTEIDLSGTDWTQIPVHQIERIEVLRGGSGSVLYGDNAQAGVVNIVTKKGQGPAQLSLAATAGSYDLTKENISLTGSRGKLSYLLDGAHTATHGYRKNSFYKAQDFAGKLGFDVNDDNSFRLSGSFHTAQFGLPGALSEANLYALGRRGTAFPDDHVNDRDYYLSFGHTAALTSDITFDADVSYRRKDVENFFLSSFAGFNPLYRNRLDTVGFTPKLIMSAGLAGRENRLIVGADLYRSDYSSDNYSDAGILQNSTDINKFSKGFYAQDELTILPKLSAILGWRYEAAQYDFDYHDRTGFTADIDQAVQPDQRAFNSGLVYRYAAGSSAFVNAGRSFRFPATDEYFSVWSFPPVNTGLKPQESTNYELGVRHGFSSRLRAELTLYRMDLRDELYYDPLTFTNSNYDKTCHRGIETAMRVKASEKLSVSGSYSLNDARFTAGTYEHRLIPMAPRHTAQLGLHMLCTPRLSANILAGYTGKRHFINDQANAYSRLNGYVTLDANASYARDAARLTLAVNNILDREYAEYGVVNSATGAKNYYPSPGRNASLKLELAF